MQRNYDLLKCQFTDGLKKSAITAQLTSPRLELENCHHTCDFSTSVSGISKLLFFLSILIWKLKSFSSNKMKLFEDENFLERKLSFLALTVRD